MIFLFASVIVAMSSLLFIDGGGWRGILGLALLICGVAGIFTSVYLVETADEQRIAACASQGGTPANGQCYFNGVAQ